MIKFDDGYDYTDFAFFLDLLDPDNNYDHVAIEVAYHKYDVLKLNMPKDCKDFRAYIKESLRMYNFICPQCKTLNNMNEDGYQINDIVETVFCSLECSLQFNHDHKDEFLNNGYTLDDLNNLA